MKTLDSLRKGQLAGLTRLDLSCNLSSFPREIYDLADTLEILNLSGNALTSLPDDLPRLHKLRVIFCSDNQFRYVPEVLGECRNLEMIGFKANQIAHLPASALPASLRWLILTDNQLQLLPEELGYCRSLQKLMLSGNLLQQLPEEMQACHNLELLRISANRLLLLPDWLLSLPALAWLAFSGNPVSDNREAIAVAGQTIRTIDWRHLDLQHKLGEGASGVIYQANWQGENAVAVKLFKGVVTSDGLPRSEKAACIAAGRQNNMIGAIGRISNHPEGRAALVMPLIDASFKNMANPPDLASCTRDIYPVDTQFTLEMVLKMAQQIASLASHLHNKGIMHGDLYAHNILWNEQGDCLLGDFGAASFVADNNENFERIEVRAFSCLLEEWLLRCTENIPDTLRELQRSCALVDVHARPLFAEIYEQLTCLLSQDFSQD